MIAATIGSCELPEPEVPPDVELAVRALDLSGAAGLAEAAGSLATADAVETVS